MSYHRVCNKRKTTGATCGAGTVYPTGAPELTPVFSGVHVVRSLVLYVKFIFYQVFSGVHVKFNFYQVFSGDYVV